MLEMVLYKHLDYLLVISHKAQLTDSKGTDRGKLGTKLPVKNK